MTAPTGYDLYLRAMTQVHHPPYPYVFGRAPDPRGDCHLGADCSGFTRWATGGWSGLALPAGSWIQSAYCEAHGMHAVDPMDAEVGMIAGHPGQGADGHVVLVGPNHTTVEARGKAYGIGVWGIAGRPLTWAYKVPGFDYSTPTPTPGPTPGPSSKERDVVKVPGGLPVAAFGNRFAYWSVKGKQIIGYNGAPIMGGKFGLGVSYIDVPAPADLTGLCLDEDGVTLIASCDQDGGTYTYRWR